MEQAIDRNTIHSQIMNTSSSQMFHRLIRRNLGDNSQSAINCIKTDENEYLFLAKDQRKAFASYYEDLSAPKPEQYDDLYVNLCKIRQKEMMKTFEDQEIPSNYFTSADIIKAIEELNMNKSADEFGLSKFNQSPSPVCQLCNLSEENISQFLLECPLLSNTRINSLNQSRPMLLNIQQLKSGIVSFNPNQALSG
ncbi:unnamed protein product [Mytilus edulis]|uniref:Uncharacterized protein n=1 Tax=Mytilus edulis TaxID=6550 RepID=A0A8S3TES6_MYTED|nr:unnamed protein product [Mytilus edulis]